MLYSFLSIAQQNKEQLAYQYFINQEYNKAIIIYEELNQKRFSIKYYRPYFSSLINTEQFISAEKIARKALKIFPKNLEYEIEIGVTYQKRGNNRKA